MATLTLVTQVIGDSVWISDVIQDELDECTKLDVFSAMKTVEGRDLIESHAFVKKVTGLSDYELYPYWKAY